MSWSVKVRRGAARSNLRSLPRLLPFGAHVRAITKREAAELASVSERTINRWIADGQLAAFTRAGHKRIYIDAEELERLLDYRPKPKIT